MRRLSSLSISTRFEVNNTAPGLRSCAVSTNRATVTSAALIDRHGCGMGVPCPRPARARLPEPDASTTLKAPSLYRHEVIGVTLCQYSAVAGFTAGTSAVCGAVCCAGRQTLRLDGARYGLRDVSAMVLSPSWSSTRTSEFSSCPCDELRGRLASESRTARWQAQATPGQSGTWMPKAEPQYPCQLSCALLTKSDGQWYTPWRVMK